MGQRSQWPLVAIPRQGGQTFEVGSAVLLVLLVGIGGNLEVWFLPSGQGTGTRPAPLVLSLLPLRPCVLHVPGLQFLALVVVE